MTIQTETVGDVLIAAPQIETLMASNVDEFRRDILPLLEIPQKVALNLSSVQFMDSSGVGAILSCLRALEAHAGKLKLFGMGKAVKGVFQITRMNRIIDGHETRDEALTSFAGG